MFLYSFSSSFSADLSLFYTPKNSVLRFFCCREKFRDLERQADRESDLRTERQRQLHADNQGYDSDEQGEPWERKPYSGRWVAALISCFCVD